MPTEYNRKMHMVRVKLPPDDTPVDVPLIDDIWFKDEQDNGQRYHFRFRNRKAAAGADIPTDKRTVRIVEVKSSGDPDMKLECERIKTYQVKFPQQNNQKKTYVPRKGNAPDIPVHLKTHDYKIVNKNNPDGPYIKMQRIDKIKLHDAQDNGQKKVFILDWPRYEVDDLSTVATMAPLDDGSAPSNPPWRFDPFQNPIDFMSPSHPFAQFSFNAPYVITVGGRGECGYYVGEYLAEPFTINGPRTVDVGPRTVTVTGQPSNAPDSFSGNELLGGLGTDWHLDETPGSLSPRTIPFGGGIWQPPECTMIQEPDYFEVTISFGSALASDDLGNNWPLVAMNVDIVMIQGLGAAYSVTLTFVPEEP